MPRTINPSNTATSSSNASTAFFQPERPTTQPILSPAEMKQLEHDRALFIVRYGLHEDMQITHYTFNIQVHYYMLHVIFGSIGTIQIPEEIYHEFYKLALEGDNYASSALNNMAFPKSVMPVDRHIDRCIALIYLTLINKSYSFIHQAYIQNPDAVSSYLNYLERLNRFPTSTIDKLRQYKSVLYPENTDNTPTPRELSPEEIEQFEYDSALRMVKDGIPIGHYIRDYSFNTQVRYHILHITYGSLGTIQIPREMYHEFYELALKGNQEAYNALKMMAEQTLCFTEDRCIALIYMTIIHKNYAYILKAHTLNSDAVVNYLGYLRSIERIKPSLFNQVRLYMYASTSLNQKPIPSSVDKAIPHESLYLQIYSRTLVSNPSKPPISAHTDEFSVEELSLDEFLGAFSVK